MLIRRLCLPNPVSRQSLAYMGSQAEPWNQLMGSQAEPWNPLNLVPLASR